MKKQLSFYDPFGKTRLSGRKTLLFCAYHGFSIPHDTAAAILYADIYDGAQKVDFSKTMDIITPSLHSFVDSWELDAFKSLGYQDLIDEFQRLDQEFQSFITDCFSSEKYSIPVVLDKLTEMLPSYHVRENPQSKSVFINSIPHIGRDCAVVETMTWESRTPRYGIISLQGDILLPLKYKGVQALNERFFIVRYNGRRERIWDREESIFLDEKYQRRIVNVLFPDSQDYLPVYADSQGDLGILQNSGDLLVKASYKSIWDYGSYILVGHEEIPDEKLLEQKGNVVIPSGYDRIIYTNGVISMLDTDIEYDYDFFPVEKAGKCFFVDRNNHRISDKTYAGICPFTRSGYALFSNDNGKLGIIDRDENVVLPPVFRALNWNGPSCLEAMRADDSSLLLISPSGEMLLPDGWSLDLRNGSHATARQDGRRAVFERQTPGGKFDNLLFENRDTMVPDKDYVIQFTGKTKNQKRHLLNYDGTPVFKKGYNDILFCTDPSRIIVKDGLRWFLMDNHGNLLHEITIHI